MEKFITKKIEQGKRLIIDSHLIAPSTWLCKNVICILLAIFLFDICDNSYNFMMSWHIAADAKQILNKLFAF